MTLSPFDPGAETPWEPPAETTRPSLGHSIAWTAVAKWTAQAVSWLSTIIVARVLSPDDYGLVGMAMVYVGAITLLNDVGLGAAIVQARNLQRHRLARLSGVLIVASAGLFLLAVLGSPVAADIFDEPRLERVALVLSSLLWISALQIVPRALLTRQLRFRVLAAVDVLQSFSTVCATLSLAILGWGYWALVLGSILGQMVGALALLVASPWPVAVPRRIRELSAELRFGAHILGANIAWYVYGNADSAVVGRMLGSAQLGFYTIASTIGSAPIHQVHGMITRVTSGTFAASQGRPDRLRDQLLQLLEAGAFLVFPATMGLAVVAPRLVHVLLGEKWVAAILPMQILAVTAMLRSLTPLPIQALVYSGRPGRVTRLTAVAIVVYPLLFIAGAKFGTAGVATAWIVGTVAVHLPILAYFVRRDLDLDAGRLGRALFRPFIAAGISAAATFLTSVLIAAPINAASGLAGSIAAGGISYLIVLRLAYWAHLRELLRHFTRRSE